MTDSLDKPGRPVSVRKNGTGATSGPATGEKPSSANRPQTVLAAAVATVLSGLFAVIASLTLYGQHSFLEHQFGKQVLTNHQITVATNAAADAFDAAKSDHAAGKISDALKKSLTGAKNSSTRAIADGDVNEQTKKAKNAANKSTATADSLRTTVQANLTKLQRQQHSDAESSADKTPRQQLIGGIVLLLISALIGVSIWRGRYWSRWAVIAIWALSSFTGTTVAGINSLFAVTADLPGLFKTAIVLCSLAMLAAVVLVLLPASGRFFALTRPAPRPGAPQRRGLFAPRVPPAPRGGATTEAETSAADIDPDRSRSKTRTNANAQSVAKGADLARRRAKASKSRRSDSRTNTES